MAKLLKHRVFISGILSPLVALVFYSLDYATLTRFSTNLEKNWLFRLSLSTLAMTVPFLVTTALALKERRTLSLSGKICDAISGSRLEACKRRHSAVKASTEHGATGRGRPCHVC